MRKTFPSIIRYAGLVLVSFLTIAILFTGCKKEDLLPKIPSTPSNGQGMFWTASDLGCGTITVSVGGYTGYITSYYSTGTPGCNAAGSATFSLAPGSYSYTASCTGGNTWSGVISITENGCSRIQLTGSGGGGGGGSTTGQGMFWTSTDLGCGNITVVCNGITRTISSFYGSSPACGSTGCATFDLSPGTYSYSASCTSKTWSGSITITAGGCSKIQLTSSGGGSTTGQGMFWIATDQGCGNITVVCNGITRTITSVYGSAPSCGASGVATFDLSPGTYSYSASCSGKTWSGTITITAGGCSKIQLTSSGGGSTTGQGMFWTAVDHGCGPITVVCNGITRTITSYYGSMPACGATGCANYSLSPGTYSYTASCSGYTWSGTITILANGCSRIQLT